MLSCKNKVISDACQEMKLREQITRLENNLIKARENQKAADEKYIILSFITSKSL